MSAKYVVQIVVEKIDTEMEPEVAMGALDLAKYDNLTEAHKFVSDIESYVVDKG